jgi:membrane dipeptidase
MNGTLRDRALRLHREAPLSDVHIQTSLKSYLFRRSLWKHRWSGKAFDPFASRADFVMLKRGEVGVAWAVHYLPERELFADCFLARLAASLVVPDFRRLVSGSEFEQLLAMMDILEAEIRKHPDEVEVAYSAADVERIRREGKLAVVHTVEGAHVLDGRLENVDILADRGVAMIALAHFYPNGVAGHVDGIPTDMFVRKLCKFDLRTDGQEPLSDFGREVIARMKERRMIVDVTHCSPEAREAIYQEVGGGQPIVASHVGVRRYNPDRYNLSDEEIREIARGGGAIGVVFISYWLDAKHPKKGVEAICKTIEHIRDVTDSWDYVVLGTDFDGFTDPPDDLRDASHVWKVTEELLRRQVPEEAVSKILGGNARRVLELGWR